MWGQHALVAVAASCITLHCCQAFVPAVSAPQRACTIRPRAGAVWASNNGLEPGSTAVVVGYEGGVAEQIVRKLTSGFKDVKVRAVLEGQGTAKGGLPGADVVFKELASVGSGDLQGATTAFVSLDRGAAEETGADTRIYAPLPALLEALPPSAAVLVAAYANDTAPGAASGFSFFETRVNPGEAVAAVRASGSGRRVVLVQHGRLFGDMPGREPLPFASGPLQKPVVEESFAKQSVLLSVSASLGRSKQAATSRASLADSMLQAAGKLDALRDFAVVSLEGPAPSAEDWDQQLQSVDTSKGVVVYDKSLSSSERVELPALQEWLATDFGPSLSQLAISRVLTAAKPTLVVRTPKGGDILWQTIDGDLTVRTVGKWAVQLADDKAGLRITRVDAKGGMLTEPLAGEQEVLQRFTEAINKLTFSKKLGKRRAEAI